MRQIALSSNKMTEKMKTSMQLNFPRIPPLLNKFRTAKPDGTSLSVIRRFCGSLVGNKHSERIILFLIILNSIMMGIGTYDFIRSNHGLQTLFDAVDRTILIMFTFESCLRLIYHGVDLFLDLWMIFDFAIVLMSWIFVSLQVVRAFRAFRAIRVMRLATHFEALRSMVEAVINIIPDVFAIVVLTVLLTYIFAVSFTELFKHLELSEDYFSRLDRSAFTLLQIMTLEFDNPMRETMAHYSAAWVPFVLFVIITSMIFNNLIIGCFCIVVSSEEGKVRDEYTQEIKESIKHYDRITTMVQKLELLESQDGDTQKVLDSLIEKIGHALRSKRLPVSITSLYSTSTENESTGISNIFDLNPKRASNDKDDITVSSSVGSDTVFHETQGLEQQRRLSSIYIKKIIRSNVSGRLLEAKPDEKVSSRFRLSCGAIVNSKIFLDFILLCIIVDAIMMGVATFDFIQDDPQKLRIFMITDQIILIIFTFEFILQFIHLGFDCFADVWLFFDLIIIILSWPMIFIQGLRSIRIVRTLRLLKYVEGMRSIFEAIFFILPRMSAIIILTVLLIYMFSVLFTELFKNLELSDQYFTRLDKSAFTLLQIMTLDQTGDIMREILNYYPYSGWIPFIAFTTLAGIIVFNLIVATLCHSLSVFHDKKKRVNQLHEDQCLSENWERLDEMESLVSMLTKSQIEMLEVMNSLCDLIPNL